MIATASQISRGIPVRKPTAPQMVCQIVPATVVQSDFAESLRSITVRNTRSTRSYFSAAAYTASSTSSNPNENLSGGRVSSEAFVSEGSLGFFGGGFGGIMRGPGRQVFK